MSTSSKIPVVYPGVYLEFMYAINSLRDAIAEGKGVEARDVALHLLAIASHWCASPDAGYPEDAAFLRACAKVYLALSNEG